MAATKPVTPAPAPEFVGAGEWVTKAELDEAYLRTHPMIQVEAGVVRATDLSRMGPGEILHIDPHETPFMALSKGKPSAQIHEWTEDELVSAIDVKPNPDPLFRLMGRKARE